MHAHTHRLLLTYPRGTRSAEPVVLRGVHLGGLQGSDSTNTSSHGDRTLHVREADDHERTSFPRELNIPPSSAKTGRRAYLGPSPQTPERTHPREDRRAASTPSGLRGQRAGAASCRMPRHAGTQASGSALPHTATARPQRTQEPCRGLLRRPRALCPHPPPPTPAQPRPGLDKAKPRARWPVWSLFLFILNCGKIHMKFTI